MLSLAKDTLRPGAYVRFKELHNKLSVEDFSREEKIAVKNIKNYVAEIKELERFLKRRMHEDCDT